MAGHAGWDAGSVYFSNQQLATNPDAIVDVEEDIDLNLMPDDQASSRFREFVRTFRSGNKFLYREQLLSNYRKGVHNIEIDLAHLNAFDSRLHDSLQKQPNTYLPIFEGAAREALAGITVKSLEDVPDLQVMLHSDQRATSMRNISANDVNRLILIPGIITSANRPRPGTRKLCIKCKHCGNIQNLKSAGPFSTFPVPRMCNRRSDIAVGDGANEHFNGSNDCGMDPYVIEPTKCTYIDQQTLKLQEAPEEVPTGEMPRNVLLSAEVSFWPC